MTDIEIKTSSRIKIAIDTVFFLNDYSGITRVWETIFTNINKIISPENNATINYEIILLIRGNSILEKLKNIISNNEGIKHIIIKEFNYITMYQDIDYLNYICKQNNINYFISTYYTYCTIIPNILMIHDMIPEIFKLPKNQMWIQKDLAIKNASQFITISNTTTKDLHNFYPHINFDNQNKYPITLIYNSIQQSNNINTDENFINNILKPNGILPKKYIFSIASNNELYKNTSLIINFAKKYSFQLSQHINTNISIVFLVKQKLPNNHIILNGILYITKVSDIILNTLYKNALCFINTSLYEGFALPVFEAFTHKIPVIALDIPIYKELVLNAINYIENDIDELFEKICFINKNINNPNHIINKKIQNGFELVKNYTPEKQATAFHNLFNSLSSNITHQFLNIIIQSYNDSLPERRLELEYCIKANLDNPYVATLHDFGYQPEKYLPEYIINHKKYIKPLSSNTNTNKWITYEIAFKYSSNIDNIKKYGSYWGLINCDIFLDNKSQWQLIRGQLNNDFIYAQSRHEFNILPNLEIYSIMDEQFAKLYHANTQDGWFFKAPLKLHSITEYPNDNKLLSINFEIGMLGCDNAITHRLVKSGYKIINQPEIYKILHYDIAKGKNSTNYLEKHSSESKNIHKNKPKNTHPEKIGSYLVPNYDQLINNGTNGEIDLLAFINSIGGISNWEKYKLISELLSNRITIINPE
jgi:glycosyltransferase involved in cell wall biosynthesis